MRFPVACAVLLALLAAASCKRSGPASVDPLDKVPSSLGAVVFGPSLVEATSQVLALTQRLEATQGTQRTSSLGADLAARIGFDPFTAEGLAKAGFKPDGAFVVAVDPEGSGNTWILPVADGEKALTALEGFARQAEQADRISQEKIENVTLKTFARPFGSREVPVMTAALDGGFLIVARGPKAAALVRAALSTRREESFGQGALMKSMGTSIPSTPIRFVVDTSRASRLSQNAKAAERLVKFLAGGLTPGAGGVDLSVVVELMEEKRDAILAGLFPKGGLLPLSTVLDADAMAAGQGTLVLETLRSVATAVDPDSVKALRTQASRVGLGLEEDLMGMTDGHYAGALYLAPPLEMAGALQEGKPLQNQLMRFMPFMMMVRPKADQTPQQVVDFLKTRFTQKGMRVAVADGDVHATWPDGPAWRSYQVAVVDGVILIGGGSAEKFSGAVKRLRTKAAPAVLTDGTSDLLMRANTSTVVLRLPALNAHLDQLLKMDLGDGADSLVMRTLIKRARQLAGIGQNVTLELRPEGNRLQGAIHLPLQKAAP